jgi:uncharacterized protein YfaS (alpha-2-macroglobulin family)
MKGIPSSVSSQKAPLALVFAAFTFLLSSLASAQVYSGSLTGVVSDKSGAVVPGANVLLTDQNKGFTYTATSDAEGRYVLRNLAPSQYQLSVSAPGMQPYVQSGITLTVGQNAQVDVHFELKGTSQTVSVEASGTLLQTQDASTGQLVNQKFINDLPLTSRSVYNLAALSPA